MVQVICGVCKGMGLLWNPETKKWDITCDNCNGRGVIDV